MKNRDEQPNTNPDANPDWGTGEGKEAYQENLRKQRENLRKTEDSEKKLPPVTDPKIAEFIKRLKKRAKGTDEEPKQQNLI